MDQNQAVFRPNYQHWGYIELKGGAKQLEPNNLSPPEHCAGANTTLLWSQHGAWAYGWADKSCSEQAVSICEFRPLKTTGSATAPSTQAVFTYHQVPATFEDAQRTCFAEGGRLASYSSLQEQVRGQLRAAVSP